MKIFTPLADSARFRVSSFHSISLFILAFMAWSMTAAAQCAHVVSVAGSATTCVGSDTLLLSGAGGASQIVWASATTSLTVDSIGGTIDTTYVPTAAGSYTAYVTLANGCPDTSNTIVVDSTITPSVTIHASTSTTICAGRQVTFTPTAVNGGTPSYQWYINGAVVATSTTLLDSTLSNGDSVWVVMTGTALCSSPASVSSNVLYFTVNPLLTPSVTITANTSDTICQNTVVNLLAAGINGGSNPDYQWIRNGVNVGNSQTYVANPIVSGDIFSCVITTTATCYSQRKASSDSITFVVNAYPAVTVTPTNTCSGDSIKLTANGGSQYVWSNGATATSIYATAGSYTVTATNAYGCTAGSIPLLVTPHAPLADSISVIGDTLTLASAPGQFYQWYRDDSIIAGAIGTSYIAAHSGYYQLSVIDSFGCRTSSAIISILQTGISTISNDVALHIYPNPNSGTFTLDMSDETPRMVTVMDALGRIVMDTVSVTHSHTFYLSSLTDGIYYLQIKDGKATKTIEFSIAK